MPATDVRKIAQDAAYVSVGVGVLAFQKAQVARREARTRIEKQVQETRERISTGASEARASVTSTARDARERIETGVADVRNRVEPVAQQVQVRIEPVAQQIQSRLPEPLAKAVELGRNRLQSLTGSSATAA